MTVETRGYAPRDLPGINRPLGWWGMVFFMLSEGILFSYLIASYFYLMATNFRWPPAGIKSPELLIASIATAVLLASSVPMFFAQVAGKRGNNPGVVVGLVLAAVLGLVFIGLQGWELSRLDFGVDTNAYGSAFITLTSFHLAHLVIGVAIVGFTTVRAVAGHFTPEHHVGLEVTALYWHFVDVVWIAVFLTIHISPHVF